MITPGFVGYLPATMTAERIGRYRWLVCGLLFLATTINYVDRQILALVKPILDDQLRLDERRIRAGQLAFQAAYAVGLLLFGVLVDRIRHEDWLRGLDRGLEPGGDRARAGRQRRRLLRRRAWRWALSEGGNFPVGHQGGGALVPAPGARARHRPLQLGRQRGRGRRAGGGAVRSRSPGAGTRPFVVAGCVGLAWLVLWLPVLRRAREASGA